MTTNNHEKQMLVPAGVPCKCMVCGERFTTQYKLLLSDIPLVTDERVYLRNKTCHKEFSSLIYRELNKHGLFY